MTEIALGAGVVGFVAALGVAAYVRTRATARTLRWVIEGVERSVVRVLALACIPGLAAAIWLATRGLPPPAALVIGAIITLGVFSIALAILRMEGVLLETSSDTAIRVAMQRPAPTSTGGRIGAAVAGAALLALAGYAVGLVSSA